MTISPTKPSRPRDARLPHNSNPPPSNSAELDARLLTGHALGLDLTGMIIGRTAPTHARTNRHASRNSPAVVSRASRSRAFSARRNSGDCRCNSRPRRWCRGPIPRRWSNWRWNCCAPTATSIARCASPISAPAPAQFCWRCCPNCRRATGFGTDISRSGLANRRSQCRARRTLGARDIHRLRLCERTIRPVRSDRLESALYPLGGYRRSGRRGPESRSAGRARWRRRRAGRLPRADPPGGRPSGARRRPGRGGRGGSKRPDPGFDDGGRVNACRPPPKPIWRAFRGPSQATKWPDKVLLERKKTPWNIARERLRSGHNIGPGSLAP